MADEGMVRRVKTFEENAGAYERYRLPFPEALFDDLLELAGTRVEKGILEVGAGTGKATVPLAHRGARIQAIDPSGDMLHVLKQRLVAEHLEYAVTLRQQTFEDIDPTDGLYGIVVAAQSFHWTDPLTRWSRLAALLGDDGLAFLFWNDWNLDPAHHELDDVRDVYRRNGSKITPDIEDDQPGNSRVADEIAAEPALSVATTRTYVWHQALPVEDYTSLLATTSQYAVLHSTVRQQLLASLKTVLGATVHLSGITRCISTGPARHS